MRLEEIKRNVVPILRKYGVKRASIFGSAVRGEMKESSDIDILVEIEKDISLLDFVALKLELEEKLGRKVDLIEYNTIKLRLGKRILKEQVVIFQDSKP
ncbi:MAG: nucleotidyltransferase family protein [Archaeoglobus sp.]|uniref:nucleotidyltransferase family protein n=1 Tax=Archaeoglobus sp. TaxID=1872626 RepID=UPI001D1F501D|nr:nucleotidyltransferase family protein [Archaeoglobus sp.]MBO8180207.1 nucleotidyltransferase family protein [Archaeoglobus sp.]